MNQVKSAGKTPAEEMERFFKALADRNRLYIIGLLKERPRRVGELAEALGLSEPTVSHHLSRLHEAGLVNLQAIGNTRVYTLRADTLEAALRRGLDYRALAQLAPAPAPDTSWVDELPLSEEDRKVMHDHFEGTQLKVIPTRQKKLLVILRWLAQKFAPGVKYSEPEVNAILKAIHPDYARLRRELIDHKLLVRESSGGFYWRPPDSAHQ